MRTTSPYNALSTLSALRAGLEEQTHAATAKPSSRLPFITISRQAGAGGRSIAQKLADRLNELEPGELKWTVWDGELVERVAAEHCVPVSKIQALEDQRPNWLETALSGLTLGATGDNPDHMHVYHSVVATICSLAEMGRVVIVGRGAVRVTREIPGGLHLRLVAPLEHRIAETAASRNLSRHEAAAWVAEVDRNRDAFYKRYWPAHPLTIEEFAAVYNTSATPHGRIVDSAVALLGVRSAGGRTSDKVGEPRCSDVETHANS
jgi:cytidylate kinase